MLTEASNFADEKPLIQSGECSSGSDYSTGTSEADQTSSSSVCSDSSSNGDESDDDSSEASASESDSDRGGGSLPQHHEHQDKYATQVRLWAEQIPIGLGLCPWAMKSKRQGRLKYQTCEAKTPADVAIQIILEAKALVENCNGDNATLPLPLSTALVVCPNVTTWNDDFQVFDEFVRNFKRQSWNRGEEENDSVDPSIQAVLDQVTLVSFHPEFLRWRGLPPGITVGSVVRSHMDTGGFTKSQDLSCATVLETSNRMFGQRKIKVRFHQYENKEQYIPIDWLVINNGDDDTEIMLGPPLPDNVMHRAPFPTIHLIRNADLGGLRIRDVSRVKRKNAQRMMKLGWEGVLRKTEQLQHQNISECP